MIVNGNIWMGDNGHCGAAEHVQLIPDGRMCYCGARGCIETYCSLSALLNQDENPADFFEALRNGSPEYVRRWEEYLDFFAKALKNLHIMLDLKIILGGELSHYLIEDDLKKLQDYTNQRIVFYDTSDFISVSHYPKDSVTVGASLVYIQDFINQI